MLDSDESTAVRRLAAAGMIALGKTHMVEFAFGSWGTNTTMGALDWDLQRIRKYDAKLHAFVTVYENDARIAAEATDR